MGPKRAQVFFQSTPLIIFWFLLLYFLLCGFVFFNSLRKRPVFALIHMACVLILIGGMWGSRRMDPIRSKWFGINEVHRGNLILQDGQSSNQLYDEQGQFLGKLPFLIKLNTFQVEYYDQPKLWIRDKQDPGRIYSFEPTEGHQYIMEPEIVTVDIVKRFNNLQISVGQGTVTAQEGPAEISNPGYEIHFVYPDQRTEKRYVFERFASHSMKSYRYDLQFQPSSMPKEYISDLEVLVDGQSKKRKAIEVNHPLYYKGYSFYQQSWGIDEVGRPYSVIEAASNRGVWIVFAGYFLLSVGLIGQMWILPALRKNSEKRKGTVSGY